MEGRSVRRDWGASEGQTTQGFVDRLRESGLCPETHKELLKEFSGQGGR